MKKLLLSLALVAGLGLAANAQTEKGGWMVGAQAANISYNTNAEVLNLNLTPQAGYFVSDNFAVGASLALNVLSVPGAGGANTTWSIGPFARAYFAGTEKSKFFAQANAGLGDIGTTVYNLGAGVGYTYFFTKNVGLETGLGYDYMNATSGGGTGISNLGLNLGFQIYLGKKK